MKARTGSLNLIGNLVVLGGNLALPYVKGIRATCVSLIRTDQPADVATATLGVLDRLCEAHVAANLLGPVIIVQELQAAKQRSGGPYAKSARAKGALFRSLGLLLQAYSTAFDDGVSKLGCATDPGFYAPLSSRQIQYHQKTCFAFPSFSSRPLGMPLT